MLFKIIGWCIAGWLIFWLLGNLLGLILISLPTIFFLVFTAITGLFIYSLLPKTKRNQAFENWLGIEPQSNNIPVYDAPVGNVSVDDAPPEKPDNNTPVDDLIPPKPTPTPKEPNKLLAL